MRVFTHSASFIHVVTPPLVPAGVRDQHRVCGASLPGNVRLPKASGPLLPLLLLRVTGAKPCSGSSLSADEHPEHATVPRSGGAQETTRRLHLTAPPLHLAS